MFSDISTVTLSAALRGLAERQQVSANNIANIETPNFSAQRVSFEDSLRSAVAGGDPSAMSTSVASTYDGANANGNNVSLDDETVIAVKTGLQTQMLTSAITAQFGLISDSLKG